MKLKPVSVQDLIDSGAGRIAVALGLEKRDARLDARVLAAHALGVDAAWLIAHDTDAPSDAFFAAFELLLSSRLEGAPIAYLVGAREFYGRRFEVSADVLIPRPATERLVELALARMPTDQPLDVLDLGTGSGCIAITLALERPLAQVTAVDRAASALMTARRNAANHRARVEFLSGNWFAALGGRRFDLIVSNPPYIRAADPHLARGDLRFEPASALAAGDDGLSDLRQLASGAAGHLKPGAVLLLEHGYDQADAVRRLLRTNGFPRPETWLDLSGIERVTGGQVSE